MYVPFVNLVSPPTISKIIVHVSLQCGETVLIFACKRKNRALVSRLLSMKANPDICNNVSHFDLTAREICLDLLYNAAWGNSCTDCNWIGRERDCTRAVGTQCKPEYGEPLSLVFIAIYIPDSYSCTMFLLTVALYALWHYNELSSYLWILCVASYFIHVISPFC